MKFSLINLTSVLLFGGSAKTNIDVFSNIWIDCVYKRHALFSISLYKVRASILRARRAIIHIFNILVAFTFVIARNYRRIFPYDLSSTGRHGELSGRFSLIKFSRARIKMSRLRPGRRKQQRAHFPAHS